MAAEISGYYVALQALLQEDFAGRVITVGDYDACDDGKIASPALLIDIESMSLGSDVGDGRLPINLHVVVHCILGIQTPDVQRQVRDMAAEVMTLLRFKKLDAAGLVAAFPQIDEALPGDFRAGKHGYESQQVRFTHAVYIGPSVWAPSGITPTDVYLGIEPRVGIPNEPEYEEITGP